MLETKTKCWGAWQASWGWRACLHGCTKSGTGVKMGAWDYFSQWLSREPWTQCQLQTGWGREAKPLLVVFGAQCRMQAPCPQSRTEPFPSLHGLSWWYFYLLFHVMAFGHEDTPG